MSDSSSRYVVGVDIGGTDLGTSVSVVKEKATVMVETDDGGYIHRFTCERHFLNQLEALSPVPENAL